ncbi:MAG: VanZ family protein [Clostridia bacterium]|nr:VanZ family protein [Clostridia bacterium]
MQILIVLIALAVLIAVLRVLRDKKIGRIATLIAVAVHFALIMYFAFLSRGIKEISGFRFALPPPFVQAIIRGWFGTVAIRSLLNLLMFVPLGYLVPLIIDHYSNERSYSKPKSKPPIKFIFIILIGLGVSLSIETAQYFFRCGVFEIDDLVKNTLGAAVGWFLYCLFNSIQLRKEKSTD